MSDPIHPEGIYQCDINGCLNWHDDMSMRVVARRRRGIQPHEAVFAWIANRYGLCHWDAPNYCA